MRIIHKEVRASCFTVHTMEGKDLNGGPVPVTDLKFSPTSNDATNSNGILSPPTTPSTATPSENDYNPTSSSSNSGRFKFFKDGKFILELWHHKNGERMFWIPVSKNSTCWPPVGHCTPRQESSTSLSVSDDNSSIQSSPWQRDHCWKQAVPRKNINRELEFMMHILRPRKMRFSSAAIRRRRRRPYDAFVKFEALAAPKRLTSGGNVAIDDATNEKKPLPSSVCVKTEPRECVEPDHATARHKTPLLSAGCLKTEPKECLESEHAIIRHRTRTCRRLSDVLQKLLERRTFECTTVTIGACRTDPGIVSPRKRILKEMEKVSLDEMGNANKKHRARTVFTSGGGGGSSANNNINAPCSTVTVMSGGTGAAPSYGGLPTCVSATASATASMMMMTATTTPGAGVRSANSHSISSILSRDEEQPSFLRHLLKSPTDVTCGSGELTSSSSSSPVAGVDMRDPLRGVRPSHSSTPVAGSLASPPPALSSSSSSNTATCPSGLPYPASAKGLPPQPPTALHPLPTYIPPAYLYGPPQPFSPPVSNHPPYYPAFAAAAAAYRDPAIWPVPSISSLGRQSVYPSASLLSSYPPLNHSPWVPVAHSSLQSYPVAENGSDVPLNLSKH